ncbi:MAG: UDP-N-acetylglucosamine--N-acetylmuramyl-(pentapeptide) pyrophosphoryl-undecaprenol N-acetylglucosamine transferase, partial [Alphaproteobacteria bacterium]|nr:UDP-N-acetylglucosamine--N-acetylmuramyl-(pentapeptide) pyrophosphoryl-undecaprenol N-acetylglucosamine transferase [Alphaproteobacteria bacterium]
VIGFGGYPCFAPVLAAKLLFVPIAVHEQNAILGRANRILAKLGAHIAASYAGTKYVSEKMHTRLTITGNPVRAIVREIAEQAYQPPATNSQFRLLICGGSQGAHVFSVILPKAIARLSQDKRARLKLIQQCPVPDLKDNLRFYNALGIDVELRDFFDDMPHRISDAHLIISRSGASTVCEIAAIGRPAIFVPLPNALDQDQMMNAMQLSTIQAAYLIPQRILTAEKMHKLLDELMDNPQKLAHMAELARSCGELEATDKLADFAQTHARAQQQQMPRKEGAM